jgi:hypothetical protein
MFDFGDILLACSTCLRRWVWLRSLWNYNELTTTSVHEFFDWKNFLLMHALFMPVSQLTVHGLKSRFFVNAFYCSVIQTSLRMTPAVWQRLADGTYRSGIRLDGAPNTAQ